MVVVDSWLFCSSTSLLNESNDAISALSVNLVVVVYGFSVGLCCVRRKAYLLWYWSKENERCVRIAVRTLSVCWLVGKYDESLFF